MAVTQGQLECKLYQSAFSGEVVFQIDTVDKESYEGVAPNHYAISTTRPTKDGVDGQIKVRVLQNEGSKARVFVPDGQILDVLADKVHDRAEG